MKTTPGQGETHMVRFKSEAFRSIPLPPEVSFEEAFSRLDPHSNSFYVLELDDECYMQCGGSPSACTVEIRRADADGIHRSYVVGRDPSADTPRHVDMSQGGAWVRESEVLTVADAVRLFECFFRRQPLPSTYTLRDGELDPVQPPADDDDAGAPEDGTQELQGHDDPPPVRWLVADDPENEFGIDGYCCAAYVRSRTSMTSDPGIAQSFTEGRTSTGAEHTGHLPGSAVLLNCAMTYEMVRPLDEGVVFRSAEMEDKWDIFHQGDRLIFCRSWTGKVTFVAEARQEGCSLAIRRVWADAGLADDDVTLPVRQVDYLIRSHVLGRTAPHPLPASFPRDPQSVGDYSFAVFGRNCSFGRFGDTVALPVLGR